MASLADLKPKTVYAVFYTDRGVAVFDIAFPDLKAALDYRAEWEAELRQKGEKLVITVHRCEEIIN